MTVPGPLPAMARVKSSWPVITVAVLSFIPGLGFLIGAAALTWALVSDRPKARLAGTIAVCGLLANVALGVYVYLEFKDSPELARSRVIVTERQLTLVVEAIDKYHAKNGAYPARLETLVAIPNPLKPLNIYDQSAGLAFPLPVYQYSVTVDGRHYDLFAVGADGEPGTPDDLRPLLSDSVAAASGYSAPK